LVREMFDAVRFDAGAAPEAIRSSCARRTPPPAPGTECRLFRLAGPGGAEQGWYETDHDTDPCVSVTQQVPIEDGLEYWLSCSSAETAGDERARQACMTPQPEDGWPESTVYLEAGSDACGAGACLTIEQRSYCSCRCDAPAGDPGSLCDCKEGFSCVPTLFDAPPGLRGSYCVRDDAFFSE
jgi:hypothetical protein